jgi:hypothetical protein
LRRHRIVVAVLAIVLLAVAFRLALPTLVERYVNHALSRNPAYLAHIGDVGLALWKGGAVVKDVAIAKRTGRVPVPLFAASRIEVSISWRALGRGALVANTAVDEPRINLVAGPTPEERQTGSEVDWRKVADELMPIRVDRLVVSDGELHFRNFHSSPQVDVYLHHVDLVAENLTNSEKLSKTRVARIALRAVPMKGGRLLARASFDPFAETPTFDFDGSLVGLRLADWNAFFRAYAGFDVERGTARAYAELESSKNRFDGYIKPFFQDVEVFTPEEARDESFFTAAWEAVVQGIQEFLEDRSTDRVASRIPLAGSVRDPRIGFWATLGTALRNAWIESLAPQLEHSVGRG